MPKLEQKKTVCIAHFQTHLNIALPNGSWVSFEYGTGDIMGWDSRQRKNFSSSASSVEVKEK